MSELTFTGNALYKAEMEYYGKFGHTLGSIHHIYLMSIIDICYTICFLATQTVLPTLPGLQVMKRCIQYLASHPHKHIFCPSDSYDGSNFIRLKWSGNQVEEYTTHNFLELHQYADHDIIINRRRSVSGIIHAMLGVAVLWKEQVKPTIAYDSTYGEIRCINKDVKKTKTIRRYMYDLTLHTGAPTVH